MKNIEEDLSLGSNSQSPNRKFEYESSHITTRESVSHSEHELRVVLCKAMTLKSVKPIQEEILQFLPCEMLLRMTCHSGLSEGNDLCTDWRHCLRQA